MATKKHILKCHPILDIDITEAKGVKLYCSNGNTYIDFESGIWCTALGHQPEAINSIIKIQINRVSHLNTRLVSPLAEELSTKLLKILGIAKGKSIFLSSGSEAVEFAIRMARISTGKQRILTFKDSYLSAYSHMQIPRSNNIFEEIELVQCISCKHSNKCHNCSITKDIDFTNLAAFVLEPGNTGGKVILPPKKLVEYLAKETQLYKGKLVINEVTTGFGRTGKLFGFMHYDIKPNIVALGKALGNGYPISAVIMDDNTTTSVENQRFLYAQSHQNDPLGCSIALGVINEIENKNLIERAYHIGEYFRDKLSSINNSIIKGVRGRGLMLALELRGEKLAEKLYYQLLKRNYLVGYHPTENILRFYPSLVITKQHINDLCNAISIILSKNNE